MKTTLFFSLLGAAALSFLAGCTATTSTTTAETSASTRRHEPGRDVYTKADLDKTGRQNVGEALAQEDPSITYTGH